MSAFKKKAVSKKNPQAGFTLAEMIVSVALFAIVVTVSTGALLTVLSTNKRAQAVQTVMNNLDFALQQMARDIRVGTSYDCGGTTGTPQDCAGSPQSSFSFKSHDGYVISYQLASSADTTCPGGTIMRSDPDPTKGGDSVFYSVTAKDICIERLNFYVNGTTPNDGYQPRVLVVLRGYVKIKQDKTYFNLQTTVSQRLLDRS